VQTASHDQDSLHPVVITHPFHPETGQRIEVTLIRRYRSGQTLVLYKQAERLVGIPMEWTNMSHPDPYSVVSGGRSPWRIDDLLRLAEIIRERKKTVVENSVA
jgi:hypothetical protein